ncbi:MAG TPA: hypothetical protein VER08_08030 [Pyrinomonadaceae bacterium]|nr:hypothetical protein [Pyrinomonadaceae bacterium]
MKTTLRPEADARGRRGERGAALVTTLLVSLLVLAMGGTLILTTAMTTTTAAEATGESQAYVAAEAGLQATLNVLRGNVAPNDAVANPGGVVADANKISFRRAVRRETSNDADDPNDAPIRLSRWLNYSYTEPLGAYADRVPVGPGAYSPLSGMAYSVEISDPDDSHLTSFTTKGTFTYTGDPVKAGSLVNNADGSCSITFYPAATSANRVTVTYTPKTSNGVTTYPALSTDLGRFTVTVGGVGATVPDGITFTLTVTQSNPYGGSEKFKASLVKDMVVSTVASTAYLKFDYKSGAVEGTRYLMTSVSNVPAANSLLLNPPATSGGVTIVSASVTAGDPQRLLIESLGYGPRGARKQLAMIVQRFRFDLEPPAPIVIRGADADPAGTTPAEMTFDLGSSNAKMYTGKDNAGVEATKASVAVSLYDWREADDGIVKGSTVGDPKVNVLDLDTIPNPWPTTNARLTPVPSAIPDEARTPDFLETADKARLFLNEMEATARGTDTDVRADGRYFTSCSTFGGMAGDDSPYTPKLTFVDGNCDLEGGAGLLIVTGNLVLNGNADFKGVIVVLGNGNVTRSGGGSGHIEGSWLIGRLIRNPAAGQSTKFLAPTFDVSGGGNSEFRFDSQKVRDANNLLGSRVWGIVEY